MDNIMNNPDYRAELQDLYTSIQLYTGLNPAAADVHPADLTRRLMDAMAAAAAALAHPEPVALTDEDLPMPAAQPEPVALTDEELWEMYELERGEPGDWSWVRDYARAAIAADRARRARPAIQPVPVAEPVAYLHRQGDYCDVSEIPLSEDEKARGWTETPLYSRHDLPIPNPTNQEDYE
jgi:hypothetical protein